MDLEEKLQMKMKEFEEEAFALNYDLAAHPEVSGKEVRSCQKIRDVLEAHGIPTEGNFAGLPTAFRGRVIEKGEGFPRIAILCEYDALEGLGHACGHSASAAISLLSVLSLGGLREDIPASVDIIGTPDEEDQGGKILMTKRGVFADYDLAIMVHLDNNKALANWKLLALEAYKLEIHGKAAHAADCPWEGRSALDCLFLCNHAMDLMRKSLRANSVMSMIIEEGGVQINSIPDFAKAKIEIRSDKKSYLQGSFRPWLQDIVAGCAKAMQCEAKLIPYGGVFDDMKHLESGTAVIRQVMGDYGMQPEEWGTCGSSDIGNVSYACPSFHPSVPLCEEALPLHSKEFEKAVRSKASEPCIRKGATVITAFLARILEDPRLWEAIQEEFKKKHTL